MPAALNEWPTGPSAAADFCNKICQLRKLRVSFEGDDGQLTIPQEEARSETARCRQKAPS
jgi:hypothetical protein